MDSATQERIKGTIESGAVVLFMKGTRHRPQCGFSAQVVQILDGLAPDYVTVDVLSDPQVRQAIKDYSNWPTIPQLYVRGEFIGGCDIVKELYASGELEKKLGVEPKAVSLPEITVSDTARKALAEALEGDQEFVRLEVSPSFEHGLSIGTRQTGDLEVQASGLTLLLDRSSASRADGLQIDMLKTPQGPAFKVTNPNEPVRVKALGATELKQKLDAGEKLELVDVRGDDEREIACIETAKKLDEALLKELLQADKDTLVVFHCHHGSRSQRAAEQFVSRGFRNVYNLVGGIDAWSQDVDPDVPRY